MLAYLAASRRGVTTTSDVPWNLIVWKVPGMAAGALLGLHLQGRINERASRRFFAGLFVALSLAMVTFTLFGEQ